ncbi:hypothetical protein L228DRAFT_270934 [Xylona heveae TC161]|uniref:CST complex subunit Ten1 n=1 Tax=Xylona heveae (strain CBS 132557 / TC161) TaxID=1328760 RepID=A0A164ZW39_XYLHT|nr:hypothetical protein L228DRAFT_270934 [Xylona heveae TC161]KZF19606.1 hypothetical protein L228DRAFT_270934 [Xylona heveae TC161]
MDAGNLGPVSSVLVTLEELPRRALGTKVRFLGCVSQYLVPSATLVVDRGRKSIESSSCVAYVDVGLVLSSLRATDIQVGEWINIIGYILAAPTRPDTQKFNDYAGKTVFVQAIMLWSAGSIKTGEYDRILQERKEAERLS